MCWLTGYDESGLLHQINQKVDFEEVFAQAPAMHPNSWLIKGVVGGVRVESLVLFHLAHGVHRYGELGRAVGGVSDKVLIRQLRHTREGERIATRRRTVEDTAKAG